MVFLAKESGQVGGERVGKSLPFRRIFFLEQSKVIVKAGKAECPQPSADPTVDEVPFRIAQRNAGMAVNELADTVEIRVGELKFAAWR